MDKDGVKRGVLGNAFQGDVGDGFVDKPAADAFFGVAQFVEVKLRREQSLAGDGATPGEKLLARTVLHLLPGGFQQRVEDTLGNMYGLRYIDILLMPL